MEEIEQLQTTDASVESSSETPQAEQGESTPAPAQEQKQSELPFHEHPRWKEVIEQRNQYAEQVKALERKFEEQSRKWEQSFKQSQPQPKDPLYERLKGIDQEFADRLARIEKDSQRAERLEQELQSYRTQARQEQAAQTVSRLYAENKVPQELQAFYEAQLTSMARANPQLDVKDIPEMFKKVHGDVSKLFESRERAAVETYTKNKTKDSATPSAPKASGPKPKVEKGETFATREEARAAAAKLMAQHLRESRNA